MNSSNVALFRLLSDLYPEPAASAQIMAVAGIHSERIFAEQSPLTRWFYIVQEAEKAGQVAALVSTALADYPDNVFLRALKDEFGAAPRQARKRLSVLAIWPSYPGLPALDQAGEADALFNAGIDYYGLSGADATRDGVVRLWGRLKPDIVEVGAHGMDGQIYLSDGPTRPGWWGRLASQYQPRLIILLACQSSRSSSFDIPDALLREGAQAVIAVSDSILDVDAVRFARVFYESYTAPMSLSDAVERAKLTLSDAGAQMIQLLEGKVH